MPADNRPKVESTSYCMKFPVFHFRGLHDFPWAARNTRSEIINQAQIKIIVIDGGGVNLLWRHLVTGPAINFIAKS